MIFSVHCLIYSVRWAVFNCMLFWIVVIFFSSRFNWSLKVWIFSCTYFSINCLLIIEAMLSSSRFYPAHFQNLHVLLHESFICDIIIIYWATRRILHNLALKSVATRHERFPTRNFSLYRSNDDMNHRRFSVRIAQICWLTFFDMGDIESTGLF